MGAAAAAALMTLYSATAVAADVTPEEVWQNWQKTMASAGQALIADSLTREGDTLVAKGVKTSLDLGEDVAVTGALAEMRLRDLGDGTVEITASDLYELRIATPNQMGEPDETVGQITQPGMRAVASGEPGNMTYVYDVPNASVRFQALTKGVADADARLELTGFTGSYTLAEADGVANVRSSTEVQRLAYALTATEDGQTVDMTGNLAALSVSGGGTILAPEVMEDMVAALAAGAAFDGAISFGAGSGEIQATGPGAPTHVTAIIESGGLEFGLNGKSLRYAVSGMGASVTVTGGELPVPELHFGYDEAAMSMSLPVAKSDLPEDFGASVRLVNLAVSNELWDMLDPTAALPRGPASLIVETSGKMRLMADLFDQAATAALGEADWAEFDALTLSDLQLRFAGAEVLGKGDLTFDNSDKISFDGMPVPTGKIEIKLTGANGLMDKLVAMGLVAPDEAMGFRMVLAMLAKPGEGADVLNSVLEFRDKGFFANGQRLK